MDMNFMLKVIKNGKIIIRVQPRSIRRFIKSLRSINWQDRGISAYLRINYGKQKGCFKNTITFYNDGWYKTKNDLWKAFNAFKEAKE
jgi:hypothetical protein